MKKTTSHRIACLFIAAFFVGATHLAHGWEVDFSRRTQKSASSDDYDNRAPSSVQSNEVVPASGSYTVEGTQAPAKQVKKDDRLATMVKRALSPSSFIDRQEFVIMNTSRGFVPRNIRLRKGLHYTAHVVNVNDDKKNISFILDGFAQHHATYFGKIKSFYIDPQQEGIFEFICPETSAKGELVIFGGNGAAPAPTIPIRAPAAE